MKWPKMRGVHPEVMHFSQIRGTDGPAEENTFFSRHVTAKQRSTARFEPDTIVSDSSWSPSRVQSFINAMFFCHFHDPISFENCVSQIAERASAGSKAFKRNGPVVFNYACCLVLLQRLLCLECLITLQFLPTGQRGGLNVVQAENLQTHSLYNVKTKELAKKVSNTADDTLMPNKTR